MKRLRVQQGPPFECAGKTCRPGAVLTLEDVVADAALAAHPNRFRVVGVAAAAPATPEAPPIVPPELPPRPRRRRAARAP